MSNLLDVRSEYAFYYKQYKSITKDIFDDIVLDGRLDKDILINVIEDKCALLTPVYQDPRLFKQKSDNFFLQKKDIITKLVDTLFFEYNPIENYDRHEDTTTDGTQDVTGEKHDTSRNTRTDNGNKNETDTFSVSAHNQITFAESNRNVMSGGHNDTITDNGGLDNTSKSNTKGNEKVHSYVHGNIGVTTTQKMIEEERQSVVFDIYNIIAGWYEDMLFILMY